MSLSPENEERLKRVALSAIALVVGGAIVKYVRDQEKGTAKGYVYYFEGSRTALVGLYQGAAREIVQFGGRLVKDENGTSFEVDTADIPDEAILEFEEAFPQTDDSSTDS